ncbi:MAG: glycosyl hydrolase [Sphingobacteriia bacterium]|nr:glycosyl hydrolase [Sphingobacteriia bacterium]
MILRLIQKSNGRSLIGLLIAVCLLLTSANVVAQKKKGSEVKGDTLKSSTFSGLKWRSIGPAFTSGRIAAFAVNPENHSEYYVAVASGHVWKTSNNGTTFEPIFDNYGAYSMGAITIDPSNTSTIWLGTGENNHQRALGYGNGVYRSMDSGKSWENMGLKSSRQIGKIIVHPENGNIVYVAAEGSAWGPGGDRGLYKTTDGGKTWEKILEISENTGVNHIAMDPRDPDVLYATAEQRRRHVYTKIGGGPESAVYKTTDGGKTWNKIMKGLPNVDFGGGCIEVSPVNPDVIYLALEAAEDKGGFFRSINRGASWEKMSDYHASGQYFNIVVPDPVNAYKVYLLDVVTKVSDDGGKTWMNVGLSNRHVDDHAMWIDPDDTNHFMIGGDGGVYETFDSGKNWLFKSNLPVTQFYRVTLDDTEPFYWVYGGTQDNNSLGGPSRSICSAGVTSCEWITTLGGDGFFQAIEPGNPDIVYSAYQYGNIYRYDKKSEEALKVRPEPRKDELTYRWNWNAPFFLSPHSKTRLYMAANKVFRSDDRGNSWEVISEDLTRNEDRNQFEVMGKYWPSNAVAKDVSTSQWGTIVSLAESPKKEGLLYAGTDDGLIQVSEDGGKNWRKISSFPGVPEFTYVSDIKPSLHDADVVFAAFDNIKRDDFKPYLLKSSDKGASWASIAGNLPDETVHTIVQDHVNPDLLFVGTEFNVFFSLDGGKIWTELSAGIPDVAMKDLKIQQRENDLVVATFGRGFYIIDDFSPLRELSAEKLRNSDALLFPVKDALMFIESDLRYGQGATQYVAKNPEFGAVFTWYLKEVPKTKKQQRLKKEKELFKNGDPIPQPTREQLIEEENEIAPRLVFTINDDAGNVIRKLYEKPSEGINRTNWDLRYQGKNPVNLRKEKFDPFSNGSSGMHALPGNYTVSMAMDYNGEITRLAGPVEFTAKPLKNVTLPADDRNALVAYQNKVAELARSMRGANRYADDLMKKNELIRQSLQNTPEAPEELSQKAKKIAEQLRKLDFKFNGTPAKASSEEIPPEPMPLNDRLGVIAYSHWNSTSAPTKTQTDNYQILMEELPPVLEEIQRIDQEIKLIETEMEKYRAPWTPGRFPELRRD